MNDSPKKETDSIRSDIDTTRQRMDDTMDALGDRLQPRHLVDEVLGYLRGNTSEGEMRLKDLGERMGRSCNSAMHSVVDSVKQNPMPAVLIGAGVAWMIYSNRRDDSSRQDYDVRYYSTDEGLRYDPDTHYDRPLAYPAATDEQAAWEKQSGSKLGEMKDTLAEKASTAGQRVKEKLSQAGDTAREKMDELRDRASEMTDRVREGARETYTRTRDRLVDTADQHPLEVGLFALAVGLVAGLALPTPGPVNRSVGPAAERLRRRTREAGHEMFEKGKRVAEAAASAAKDEARAQGLTPDRLREQTKAVAERARDAGAETAQREGLAAGSSSPASNSPASDPSVARPVV